MKATRGYYNDVIKIIDYINDNIEDKDGCYSDDIFDKLSPSHGQAIMNQLIKGDCIESTFDGWFIKDEGALQTYRELCESELSELENKEKTLQYSKQAIQYSKQANIRGWIALVISILAFIISIVSLCK